MSRRGNQAPSQQTVSNAGGSGSQNSGAAGSGSAASGGQKSKRVPGRDSRTNVVIEGAAEFREGEVYYRTVTRYDGLPGIPDSTTVDVARPTDLPAASSPPTGGSSRDRGERRKSGIDARRGSTLPTISSDEDTSLANKAASASGFGNLDSVKRRNVVLWPEWNDVDVSNEKWDVAHAKPGVKDKGSKALAVTPVPIAHGFDDPEGKCELPPSLKAAEWRRPLEFIVEKNPVVVDVESMNSLDLFSANEVVHESETMRWITTQISGLWKLSEVKLPEGAPPMPVIDPNNVHESMLTHSWRPWEHIYALAKQQGKGGVATVNVPQFNSYGKYVVKLFFMGCWRKVVVDDLIPFDQDGHMLLPASVLQHELWPMLLAKALLKVAALDYSAGGTTCEFGDFNVIHCLTGWLPEVVRLPPAEHYEEIWKLLKSALPEFTLPEQPGDGMPENERRTSLDANAKDEKTDKDRTDKLQADKMDKFGRESKKDTKGALDKKKKGEKDENKLKMTIAEEPSVPEHPEVVVFAVYHGVPKSPARITKKKEMADAFEALRQHGFSHCYPHPVLLTQTRSCPLVPPPPPEKIPAWKTVRPRKKPGDPDSPDQKDPDKPIQCVHVVSPFINYKLAFEVPETTSTAGDPEEKTAEEQEHQSTLNPAIVSEEMMRLSVSASSAIAKSLKSDEPVTSKLDAKRRKSKMGSEPAIKDSELTSSPKIVDKRLQSGRGSKKFSVAGVQKMSLSGLPAPEDNLVNSATLISSDAKKDETSEADDTQLNDVAPVKERVTEAWMDFEVLCKSFKQLHIYHKPSTYSSNHRQSDLKPTQPATVPPPKSDKAKSASNVATPPEEKSPFYFFIDSLKPTEIVVSFSALCHWNEVALPRDDLTGAATTRALQTKGGGRDRVDRESRLGDNFMTIPETGSMMYEQPSIISAADAAPKEPLKPGVVVAEPYSWKSLSTGPPVLQIHTTGTRATAFCLPEGRHVLRFSVSAPLGYQLHLISTTNFVFGDEEKIMMEQTKESLRFMDTAVRSMQLLGKCLSTFSDPARHAEAEQEFSACHCPYTTDTVLTRSKHKQALTEAIYTCVKKVLTDAQLATPDMNFALRAFNYDCLTKNPLGLPYGAVSRPATGASPSERVPSTPGKKAAAGQKKREASEAKADPWKNREITDIEINAATRIEALWRGFSIRKISLSRNPESDLCMKVQEQLIKAWGIIEQNLESCGAIFLRTLFRLHPQILSKFSFCKDEWSRVTYIDYQGAYPEHPMNTWFVVFREVFHIVDEMLCVPRLSCSLSNCLLSVINNDTLEQVPRICAKVVPHVYAKNKRGYTFLVEAKSPAVAVSSGHWRMRLLGATSPLPVPVHNDICSSFNVLDIHDYYIPNEKDIILRYRVKVTEEHLATVKVSTSKTDVRFKLSIIDNDEEVASCEGRGLAILPAFVFLPDPPSEVEEPSLTLHRSTSRLSAKRGSRSSSATKISSAEKLEKTERISRHGSVSAENVPTIETKTHKYFIQAVVLRKTWPLSRSQWAFVQQLKEKEIEDLKVESSLSPQRAAVKNKDPKKGVKNVTKDKPQEPANSLFNSSMANWTLVVVSDADTAEAIEVKKDTERADEIRAMKLAWEEAEPGRAAKAKQSRLNYLKTHMVRCDADEMNTNTSGDSSTLDTAGSSVDLHVAASQSQTSLVTPSVVESNDDDTVLTNMPPPPPPKKTKEVLLPIDLTPFLRKTTEIPRLLDDEEEQRQMDEKRAEIAAWRQTRAEVLERREKELRQRNAFKKLTLQIYEDMQIKRDEDRAAINERREAYRQRLLEEERQRQEQVAAAEAAVKAEQEKNNPSPRGQKAGGTKSPVGKKKK